VIDEDLGCSGSGLVERTGFEQLVARYVPAPSERSSAWKPRAWRAMGASGIT